MSLKGREEFFLDKNDIAKHHDLLKELMQAAYQSGSA